MTLRLRRASTLMPRFCEALGIPQPKQALSHAEHPGGVSEEQLANKIEQKWPHEPRLKQSKSPRCNLRSRVDGRIACELWAAQQFHNI